MNHNIEKEYKVLVSKEQFYKLFNLYEALELRKQTNVYYDTKDFSIRKHHGSMRIRDVAGKHIFTLKMHSDTGLLEFEKEVLKNSVEVLLDEEISVLLKEYDLHGPFYEITSLSTQRAVYFNGYAELCFDINTYNGIIDYEIEYEYKKDHDGLLTFQNILKPIQVEYHKNCISKIQRAINTL